MGQKKKKTTKTKQTDKKKKKKKCNVHKDLLIAFILMDQFTTGLLQFDADNSKFCMVSSDFLYLKNFLRKLKKVKNV